jgi:hypothetical protein
MAAGSLRLTVLLTMPVEIMCLFNKSQKCFGVESLIGSDYPTAKPFFRSLFTLNHVKSKEIESWFPQEQSKCSRQEKGKEMLSSETRKTSHLELRGSLQGL